VPKATVNRGQGTGTRHRKRFVSFRFDTRSEILVLEPVFRSNPLYGAWRSSSDRGNRVPRGKGPGGNQQNPPLGTCFGPKTLPGPAFHRTRGATSLPPTIPGKLTRSQDPCPSAVKERYTVAMAAFLCHGRNPVRSRVTVFVFPPSFKLFAPFRTRWALTGHVPRIFPGSPFSRFRPRFRPVFGCFRPVFSCFRRSGRVGR
jgi:hypothetical protein